jgi:hypothetical protein
MSYVAIAAGVVGAGQAIYGGIKSHQAQKRLEKQQTPTYTKDKGIMDYYQEALNRYQASPYNTLQYQQAQRQAQQGLATGIGALRESKMGGAGNVAALVGNTQNQLQGAAARAEAQKAQEFGQLGRAAQMGGQQNQMAFQYNQMLPYQSLRQLYGLQASGAAQTEQAGLSNIGSALNNLGITQLAYKDKGLNFWGQ